MPNIFTCDSAWFTKLIEEQPKAIVALWAGEDEKVNQWLEKLQALEDEGIPVFVCDVQSCPGIAEKLGAKGGGETIVFQHGEEKGRITPAEDFEAELSKVKELVG